MEKNRRPTWIEFYVKPPVVGTVFIHATKPEKPCIVHKIVDEEIYRTDADGKVNGWGTIDDWREEVRRRTIKVVYDPSDQMKSNEIW